LQLAKNLVEVVLRIDIDIAPVMEALLAVPISNKILDVSVDFMTFQEPTDGFYSKPPVMFSTHVKSVEVFSSKIEM
jgi:hypothetical protein